eukprot:2922288-Rhodomonas_salina.1
MAYRDQVSTFCSSTWKAWYTPTRLSLRPEIKSKKPQVQHNFAIPGTTCSELAVSCIGFRGVLVSSISNPHTHSLSAPLHSTAMKHSRMDAVFAYVCSAVRY